MTRTTYNTVLSWRLLLWASLAALFLLASGFPDTVRAQVISCSGTMGQVRAACIKESARQQSAINRAKRDAARGRQQSDDPIVEHDNSRADPSSRATPWRLTSHAGGVYADPPTIDRSVKPALLRFVVHPSYSRTPGKLNLPITHGCTGSSYAQELTFNKACHIEIMQGEEAALPLFQQSCEEGDPAGCFMYADHTESSNRPAAMAMYDNLCDIGHPNACYRIALAYEKGTGVARNAAMQRTYYERACDAGNEYGCSFIAGKIDADCPHGHRGWRADYDRKIYKVVCVVDTGALTTSEHEIPPKPGEIEAIKGMAGQAKTSIPQWYIDALDAKPYDPGCFQNDVNDSNGRPIAGSGCAGVRH